MIRLRQKTIGFLLSNKIILLNLSHTRNDTKPKHHLYICFIVRLIYTWPGAFNCSGLSFRRLKLRLIPTKGGPTCVILCFCFISFTCDVYAHAKVFDLTLFYGLLRLFRLSQEQARGLVLRNVFCG